jgi:hypothetical protein
MEVRHFLQRSTHFSKTCCRPLITSKFLASELLFMVGKAQKTHGSRPKLNCVFGLEKVDRWNSIRTSVIQSSSSNHEKGAPRKRNFEVINGLQQVFEKWVERCKSASLANGGTSKKRQSPHLHKDPTRSNKGSPRTFQTVLIFGEAYNL